MGKDKGIDKEKDKNTVKWVFGKIFRKHRDTTSNPSESKGESSDAVLPNPQAHAKTECLRTSSGYSPPVLISDGLSAQSLRQQK
jgi:hypothetical protein